MFDNSLFLTLLAGLFSAGGCGISALIWAAIQDGREQARLHPISNA